MNGTPALHGLWTKPADAVPSRPANVHLIGIAGTGMKALAELLCDAGWNVQGTDQAIRSERERVIGSRVVREYPGPREDLINAQTDLVIYSTAVPATNVERQRAEKLQVPSITYPQALSELTRQRPTICVAGTHGKSTTSAMLVRILEAAEESPSWLVGAERSTDHRNGRLGAGRWLVLESCEYRRHFLELSPHSAVIQAVEWDHVDCFRDELEMRTAFEQFVSNVPHGGLVLVQGEIPNVAELVRRTHAAVLRFGRSPDCDWRIEPDCTGSKNSGFRLTGPAGQHLEIRLSVPGWHNCLNATAAAAMAAETGIDSAVIEESLAGYSGIARRFERYPDWEGRIRIDDYAHHPTAVRATLETARAEFPQSRIWVIFEPHQASRLRAFRREFAEALSLADQVLVAPVFGAREAAVVSSTDTTDWLTAAIKQNGIPATRSVSLDQILATLQTESRPGDVLLTVGAGEINRVQHEFNRRL